MKLSFSFVILILLSFAMLGCKHIKKPSFIQNRDTHYLTAKSVPPMRIPPGLSSDQFENYYPIADRNYPPQNKSVSITPPDLYD